jgi:hypothetical protein
VFKDVSNFKPTIPDDDPASNASPQRTISPPNKFDDWQSAFESGVSALRTSISECNDTDLGRAWPYELSLVAMQTPVPASVPAAGNDGNDGKLMQQSVITRVGVIAWTMPSLLKGRIIPTPDNHIMALVPSMHKEKDLNQLRCTIILPAIGERAHRSKDRPPLPPLALQLKKMWEAAIDIDGSHSDESLELDNCFWCCKGGLASASGSDNAVEAEPLFTCAVCLLVTHTSCCHASVVTHTQMLHGLRQVHMLNDTGNANQQILPEFFKPRAMFRNVMCGVCAHMW